MRRTKKGLARLYNVTARNSSSSWRESEFWCRNVEGSSGFSLFQHIPSLSSKMDSAELEELKKKRQFRKFSYRGVDLEQLLTMNLQQVTALLPCRARRVIRRGAKHKKSALMKKLRNAKKNAPVNEKPEVVKTHLRNAIILPEMIGCVVGIHNGKVYNQVEIKPEMIGHYLGEFSMTYKPVKHGRPGIGATHSSRFIPLK